MRDAVALDGEPDRRVGGGSGADGRAPGPSPFLVPLLGVLGAWTVAVPYVGPPLGLELDVAGRLEVVDHVLPGIVIVAAAGLMVALVRCGFAGGLRSLAAACLIALAGLWVTATHVPLLADAGRGLAPWGAAIFHSTPGLVILALSLRLVAGELREDPPLDRDRAKRSRPAASR